MTSSINWSANPPSASPPTIQSNTPVYSSQSFRPPVEYTSQYAAASLYPSQQPLSADSDPVQLPSSVGPSRTKQSPTGIVTRRKAAQIAMQSSHSRENSGPFSSAVHSNGHPSQRTGPFVHLSGSRSNSQNDYHHLPGPYQTPQSDLPPLNLPPATTMGLPPNGASPQYPATPASTSPYSPYNFFNTHSRSNSNSNSNPRSTSPALSVASALTSVSSSTGPSKGQGQINSATVVRKHKKQRLFNVDRKEICLYHKENPTARQEDIAIKYGVERSTISKILKHKQKWMNVPTEEEFKVAKHRPSKFPEIESQLVDWLSTTAVPQNITLSDSLIRNKARDIAKALRISEDKFKASSGWVENFKHRHGIRRGVWHGDGKASKLTTASDPSPLSNSNLPANDASNEDRGAVLPPFNTSFPNRRDSFMNDRTSNTLSPLREVQIDHNREDYGGSMRSPLNLPPPWSTSDRSPVHDAPSSRNASDQSYNHSDTTSASIPAMSLSSLRAGWDSQSPVHPLPPPLHPSTYDNSHGQPNQACSDPNVHPTQSHMGSSVYPLASSPPHRPESVTGRFTIPGPYPPLPISPSPLYRNSEPVPINEAEDACDKVIRFVDSQPPGFITDVERDALTQIKYTLFHIATGVPREPRR